MLDVTVIAAGAERSERLPSGTLAERLSLIKSDLREIFHVSATILDTALTSEHCRTVAR